MTREEVSIPFRNKDPLVVGNQVFTSSSVWDLTEMELEKARVELGETEEKKRRFLQEMKDRLSKEGNYRLDDPFLLRFLRVRKYDFEKAYLNVKKYYNVRKKYPDLYGTPSNLSSLKSHSFASVLPYADEEGRILLWLDFGCWDPQEESYTDVSKVANGFVDLAAMNPKCQVNGFVCISDVKELGFRHVVEMMRRNQAMSNVSIVYYTVPWRIKKIFVVNTGRATRFLYSLVRPMMKKKLTERIVLLGSDFKELHHHMNPEILPKKLGGKLEDDACRSPNFVLDNIPYLEYERSFTGAWEGK